MARMTIDKIYERSFDLSDLFRSVFLFNFEHHISISILAKSLNVFVEYHKEDLKNNFT